MLEMTRECKGAETRLRFVKTVGRKTVPLNERLAEAPLDDNSVELLRRIRHIEDKLIQQFGNRGKMISLKRRIEVKLAEDS